MSGKLSIDRSGDICWLNDEGRYHREGDKPARILSNGCIFYMHNGELHRDYGKPAVLWTDGTEWHYIHGRRLIYE